MKFLNYLQKIYLEFIYLQKLLQSDTPSVIVYLKTLSNFSNISLQPISGFINELNIDPFNRHGKIYYKKKKN